MSVEIFGQMPDGRVVEKVTIAGGGLAASVLTYGAVLQDLRLGGHDKSLVLGFTELEPYLTSSPYFGAIVGRYANRIRDGHLPLEGKVYQLDRNFLGKHTLHGGTMGTSALLWHLDAVEANAVRLSVRLADGDMGFPGAMDISVSYRLLDDGVMDLVMEAQCDAPSLCNLAHHSYFNLDGGETILDHLLKVDAEQYLPVDDGLIRQVRWHRLMEPGLISARKGSSDWMAPNPDLTTIFASSRGRVPCAPSLVFPARSLASRWMSAQPSRVSRFMTVRCWPFRSPAMAGAPWGHMPGWL